MATRVCPCLLQWATGNPQITDEGGHRVVAWTCRMCGTRNRERRKLRDGGPRGPASVAVMGPTVSPDPCAK